MSGKARALILVGTALIAMLVGAASFTLYRLWPRHEVAQTIPSIKPEDMETYKAAATALSAFTARPQCDGDDARNVATTLTELKEDAKVMGQVAGLTDLSPDDYLKPHIALSFDFARQAQDHGCLDVAEQQYRGLAATYPDDADVQTRATAGVSAIQGLRGSPSP